MTDSQIAQWKTERDIAREIRDPEDRRRALEKVYDHRDEMQMECIAHQSARSKRLEENQLKLALDVQTLAADVKPLKAFKAEVDKKRVEFKGAKWGFGLALVLVGKFGWDAVNAIWSAIVAAH